MADPLRPQAHDLLPLSQLPALPPSPPPSHKSLSPSRSPSPPPSASASAAASQSQPMSTQPPSADQALPAPSAPAPAPPQPDHPPQPQSQPPQPEPPQPQTQLTLLLLSGSRKTFAFPPETTVGRVKELVWGSWPNEWRDEQLPPSPSYFRLLHLGRMLQDDSTLASNNLHPTNTPQIVHLSIKAFVPPVESSTKAKKRQSKPVGLGGGGADERDTGGLGAEGDVEGGCCGGCVVM